MSLYNRLGVTPSLQWLSAMTQLLQTEPVVIPTEFTEQVTSVKKLLENDVSGMVNSLLDFAINCATLDYYVETDNSTLTGLLNNWLYLTNDSLRGKVPVGIKPLAKEYFRERWKGSSLIVMRTIWENVNGFILPTKIWFVDGENLNVKGSNDGIRRLGEEKYVLVAGKDEFPLPSKKDERIFVQKPFSSWGVLKPTPFLIQRGLYKNLKVLEILEEKGEQVLTKALEYLMMVKKGTEKMAMSENPDFIYSKEDLEGVQNDLRDFLGSRKSTSGTSVYATNFDTEIQHLIPEYSNILKAELYSPIERRILAGLGMIDIVQGTTSSRRESLLNPKPFIQEVRNGIEDFKTLFTDVINTIVELNKDNHKKFFSEKTFIQVHNSPITAFFDADIRQLLRSMYDRGVLSKRTFVEVVGEFDFDIEVERRTVEAEKGLEELMFPPVINNIDEQLGGNPKVVNNEDQNKSGPEKKNFDKASVEDYEEAPYKTNKDLPPAVKKYPSHAQDIFRNAFNSALKQYKDEQRAFQVAWSALKKYMKQHQAEKASLIEKEEKEMLRDKNKLIKKLIEEENNDENI